MQQHALEYLARMDGYESVDELIRSKVDDYAAQGLTYEQAEKNAGEAGTVKKVMTRIREMLSGVLNRAKEVLTIDPENRAALKAKRLAEAERKILQDEYFAHAETAMDTTCVPQKQATAKTPQPSRQRTRRKSWMCGIEYAGADEIRNAFESGDMDQLERLADRAADALVTKSTYSSVDRLPRHRLNWHGSRV